MVHEVITKVKEGVKGTVKNVNESMSKMLQTPAPANAGAIAPTSKWQQFYQDNKWYVWLTAASIGIQACAYMYKAWKQRVKGNTILELDLEDVTLDDKPTNPNFLQAFSGEQGKTLHFKQVVEILETAANDARVKGIIVTCGGCAATNRFGLGHVQELREALQEFRKNGKKAVVHAESLGLFQNALASYYFMSAFDEIHVAPVGMVFLPGILISAPFIKKTFEKLGMEPLILQREGLFVIY